MNKLNLMLALGRGFLYIEDTYILKDVKTRKTRLISGKGAGRAFTKGKRSKSLKIRSNRRKARRIKC